MAQVGQRPRGTLYLGCVGSRDKATLRSLSIPFVPSQLHPLATELITAEFRASLVFLRSLSLHLPTPSPLGYTLFVSPVLVTNPVYRAVVFEFIIPCQSLGRATKRVADNRFRTRYIYLRGI